MNKILSKTDFVAFMRKVSDEALVGVEGYTGYDSHVFRSYEEAKAKLDNGQLKWPAIQMGRISGRGSGKMDSNFDIKRVSFAVLYPAGDQDFEREDEAVDKALEVGWKLIERMLKYATRIDYVQRFSLDSITYDEVRSMLDQSAGVQFNLEIGSLRNLDNEF